MTSEKHTMEIFSWGVLLSKVFKKQDNNKRRIRESESVETRHVLLSHFPLEGVLGGMWESSSLPPPKPLVMGAYPAHICPLVLNLTRHNELWPDRPCSVTGHFHESTQQDRSLVLNLLPDFKVQAQRSRAQCSLFLSSGSQPQVVFQPPSCTHMYTPPSRQFSHPFPMKCQCFVLGAHPSALGVWLQARGWWYRLGRVSSLEELTMFWINNNHFSSHPVLVCRKFSSSL